jgi:hypothetical protein
VKEEKHSPFSFPSHSWTAAKRPLALNGDNQDFMTNHPWQYKPGYYLKFYSCSALKQFQQHFLHQELISGSPDISTWSRI